MKALAGLLQTSRVKASVFRNRPPIPGSNGPLVIDAMDEVARIDTLATDQIIAQASETLASAVVFAGRSGEWDQGRTAYVEHCFGVEPILVYLQAFTELEQRQLFSAEFPDEDFDAFAAEVRKFELGPLLGNPQFLKLLGEAYLESGRVFVSKARIFADAVKRLAHEANPELGRQKTRPSTDAIIALGKQVFAKLMLSGAAGVATIEQLCDRDFPYINGLVGQEASQAQFLLDTRLLKPSEDADKHEPIHRIVAEYCAAGYLVKRIEDPADRLTLGRVLSIIAPNGVTRDELRGMLGWMAALGREPLQLAAISLDPYTVLANGDPSQLTPASKRHLLISLDNLAEIDPLFRRSDIWRKFNVGQFFMGDILGEVGNALAKPGSLRNLLLEILDGTSAAADLVPDLRGLMKDPSADGQTRKLALEALLSVPAYNFSTDFADLLAENSSTALEIASRGLSGRGAAAVGEQKRVELLTKLGELYPKPGVRDRDGASRYFISRLVKTFDPADLPTLLDGLSAGLTCTCLAKHGYECRCRFGMSKLIGMLLDRFFESSPSNLDPARVWSWLKPLHFRNGVTPERSASVRYLSEAHELRRSVQQLALQGVIGEDAAHDVVMSLYSSHTHSGIVVHEGDRNALSKYAFEQELVDVWSALWTGHSLYNNNKGSNPTRAEQRKQSHTSRAFLEAWSRRERLLRDRIKRERQANRIRRRRRHVSRDVIEEQNRAHLRQNIAVIEAGQHWPWLMEFAKRYLFEPDRLNDLVDDPETPLRALRNCFPMLVPYVPTVENLGRRERPDIAEVLLAACIVQFRDGESLDAIDPRILAAATTEASSYPCFAEGEESLFEAALDAALFRTPGAAEAFLREYIEAQLTATDEVPIKIYWLNQKPAFQHLRASLPLEWLERFPSLPWEGCRSLFSIAARYGDRNTLIALIDRRLSDPIPDTGADTEACKAAISRRRFWQLNAFLYDAAGADEAWNELVTDPNTIFALDHRIGRFSADDHDDTPPANAQKILQIMDAFVEVWPKVPLPNSWGTGDPEEEIAYRFLRDLIWKIVEDTPERRIPVLDRMAADAKFSDFREIALTLRAEAGRQLALQEFRAPSPSEINGLLDANEVASVEDLRALMVQELAEVEKWLKGSETDPLDTFYPGGTRVDENTARNRIVDRLQGRMTALGLSVVIERHMASSNRCDITASAVIEGMQRLLVTEVKGQWNKELFTAAAAQLDKRYAIHPDAAKQGVYLVLWFGNGEKIAGFTDQTITSPAELMDRILSTMPDELQRRVNVVVLDLSRPLQP